MGMNVNVDHVTVFLDDVPDLHLCKPKRRAIIGVFVSEMYSKSRLSSEDPR
jgi:hypothetical protein